MEDNNLIRIKLRCTVCDAPLSFESLKAEIGFQEKIDVTYLVKPCENCKMDKDSSN